jgi:MoaD family protein
MRFMATLRLFAAAREAAGTGQTTIDADTVSEVLAVAVHSYGPTFQSVLANCKVWVNGEPAESDTPVGDKDEVAVLPPVSGGCS